MVAAHTKLEHAPSQRPQGFNLAEIQVTGSGFAGRKTDGADRGVFSVVVDIHC